MNRQDTIEAQSLLNHHQYDRAGYLDACKDAGIDTKQAADFCDEVYTQLGNDNGNRGDWSAVIWMLGTLSLIVVMLFALWLAARPLIEKIVAMKP